MKTLRLYFLTLPFAFVQLISFSQFSQNHQIDHTNCRAGENVEYCRTHHVMNKLKSNPAFMKIYEADQEMLRLREEEIKKNKQKGTVYIIPVVFHILHNGGVENISTAQVQDAVDILNRDYRLLNTDASAVQSVFQGMPSDIEIEFVLATKAPNGQCFSGITRTQSALSYDGSDGYDQVMAIVNGNNVYNGSWPGDEYLNIFVCGDIGGAAGYTTNPSNWGGTQMTNGIWVLDDYVGSIGTSGIFSSRTLTHEVGHWLNLDHCWGNNNNPGNSTSCSEDDNVDDTPRCIGVTACITTSNTCSNDAVDGYWSSDVIDNIENYMEYSYCSKMFTDGQRSRMRAALTSGVGGRNNLWKTSNLNATGANGNPTLCAAAFLVDRQLICQGDSLQFIDDSYNNVSGWSWSFQGGNPSVSTGQNPLIKYDTPGTYDITLSVNDPLGNVVSQTFNDYITVMGAPGRGTPVDEGFESISSLPSSDWFIYNPDNGPGFQVVSTAAATGSKSMKLDNTAGNNLEKDEFISSTIDLSNISSATLSFKYAFAKRSTSNTDFLQVLASNSCGDMWAVRKNISAQQIATMNNTTANYTPGPNDWATVSISNFVPTYMVDNFRFKIAFTNGGGNDLYIDDINISGPVSLQENETVFDFFVFPNPVNNIANVQFNLAENKDNIEVGIYDMVGKKIKNLYNGPLSQGGQDFSIDVSGLSKGVYFVSIISSDRRVTQKMIVE